MDSKLKYYLQMADSAMVMATRLNEQRFEFTTFSTHEVEDKFILSLQTFAQEIYLETLNWHSNDPIIYSDWLHKRKCEEMYNCLLSELKIENPYGRLVQNLFCETYIYLFLFESFLREDIFIQNMSEKYLPSFYNQLLHTQYHFERLEHHEANVRLKIQEYVLSLWKYVDDLFQVSIADIEMYACLQGVDFSELRINWEKQIAKTLSPLNVFLPVYKPLDIIGKEGQHTQNLTDLLNK
jgi:Phenylacetic acid catabolic protein